MKNEILEFFSSINLNNVIENATLILNTNKINEKKSDGFALLRILHEYINLGKIDGLVNKVSEVNNDAYLLENFIKEEEGNIIDFFKVIQLEREESYPKLIDFEWKFIGLSDMESFEKSEMTPKILLKLKLNNGVDRLIETDFANLKKLQEEIDENLSSFNSSYSRRIDKFSK